MLKRQLVIHSFLNATAMEADLENPFWAHWASLNLKSTAGTIFWPLGIGSGEGNTA